MYFGRFSGWSGTAPVIGGLVHAPWFKSGTQIPNPGLGCGGRMHDDDVLSS